MSFGGLQGTPAVVGARLLLRAETGCIQSGTRTNNEKNLGLRPTFGR